VSLAELTQVYQGDTCPQMRECLFNGPGISSCDEARRRVADELPDLTAVIDTDVSNLEQVQSAFVEAIDLMDGAETTGGLCSQWAQE